VYNKLIDVENFAIISVEMMIDMTRLRRLIKKMRRQ
jgi:hypothetical protein